MILYIKIYNYWFSIETNDGRILLEKDWRTTNSEIDGKKLKNWLIERKNFGESCDFFQQYILDKDEDIFLFKLRWL